MVDLISTIVDLKNNYSTSNINMEKF